MSDSLFILHQQDVAKMSDTEFEQVWTALGVVAKVRQRSGLHPDLCPIIDVGRSLRPWAQQHMPGSTLDSEEFTPQGDGR